MAGSLISDIDNVGICVTDLGRSVEFYERLGFENFAASERGVTLVLRRAKLFLFENRTGASPPSRPLDLSANPPGLDHVSFLVEDVDGFYEEVRGLGIEVDGEPADRDWGARAFGLRDPDGNNLYFVRWI
jgi:catechol 2,3-dioxygenase-like lactoylglutathione lyase family enzyme